MIGSAVYIIDDDYRLLLFNQKIKELFPNAKEGEVCYKSLANRSEQCANCPLKEENRDNLLFMNTVLKQWVNMNVADDIEYQGKNCKMLNMTLVNYSQSERLMLQPSGSKAKTSKRKGYNFEPGKVGLLTRERFLNNSRTYLSNKEEGSCCFVACDIEHFKLFNKWYGVEYGDQLLEDIGICIKTAEQQYGGVSGYFGGDDFVLVMPYNPAYLEELIEKFRMALSRYQNSFGFLPACGVYVIDDYEMPISYMYDRAGIALNAIKGKYAQRIGYYENRMLEEIEEEYATLSMFRDGLDKGEFVFHLQPKCHLITGAIVGAEALTRWEFNGNAILPEQFLPVLEKNGFITTLDCYIWEQVCKWQKKRQDQGYMMLPISVNVSVADILSMDVAQCFVDLVRKYNLSPEWIDIEITESAYTIDFESVCRTVDRLHQAGFLVMMDDFGSGVSSLNMLKDVNVDIIKVDMRFLQLNQENSKRGKDILSSIVDMFSMLQMPSIVEGVETRRDAMMLQTMGSTYVQGYYFYEPMPVKAFEQILDDSSKVDYNAGQNRRSLYGNTTGITSQKIASTNDKLMETLKLARLNSWDWNLREHTLTVLNVSDRQKLSTISPYLGAEQAVIANFPECIIQHELVADEFKESFWRQTQLIYNAKDRDVLSFHLPLKSTEGIIWLNISAVVLCDSNGKTIRSLGYYTDVSEQIRNQNKQRQLQKKEKAHIEQLTKMAQRDYLTGLYNRQTGQEKIMNYFAENPQTTCALIVLDVDQFKYVNDHFGHTYGDSVLATLSHKLEHLFRSTDIVCRLGGDEFMVLCTFVKSTDFHVRMDWIVNSLVTEINNGLERRKVTMSAGFVVADCLDARLNDLYAKADEALLQAKAAGKNCWRQYTEPGIDEEF